MLATGTRGVIRFILGFFGSIFSWLTLAAVMGALTLGAVFFMYSRDLPSHEQLANYQPPTISRIYSGQGRLMDEFAKERRLYTPPEQIPGKSHRTAHVRRLAQRARPGGIAEIPYGRTTGMAYALV